MADLDRSRSFARRGDDEDSPRCPRCSGPMKLRTSYRGPFWGCRSYPDCKGTRDASASAASAARVPEQQSFGEVARRQSDFARDPSPAPVDWNKAPVEVDAESALKKGSAQQEAIWKFMLKGKENGVVDAGAGTGKTWTIGQGILRLRKAGLKIGVMSFNNHIMREMNERLMELGIGFARGWTYNSFGFRALLAALKIDRDALDESKLDTICTKFVSEDQPGDVYYAVRDIARLCKCYLIDGTDRNALEEIAAKHDIETCDSMDLIASAVPQVLKACLEERSTYDFDDQVWMTVKLQLPTEKFDILFIDEAQDTNKMQQALAFHVCPTGRIIVVGDRRQSIYGFRGADITAMPSLQAALAATKRGCKSLPLTVTRRCPKSHVRLAQAVVGTEVIQALPDAPEGVIDVRSQAAAIDEMRPGDLVMCRVNRHLIPVCYKLIRKGVKAVIRGRDIGKGILTLINKLRPSDVPDLLRKLNQYEDEESKKLIALGKKGTNRLMALRDRCECIVELCDGVYSVSQVKAKVQSIFSEFDESGRPKNAVVLGTVHRTKGLEANTTFILAPELIPHPMAVEPWELEQEENIAYIAVTRAKFEKAVHTDTVIHPGRIVFCGPVPPIYKYDPAATVVDVAPPLPVIEESFIDLPVKEESPAVEPEGMADLGDPETVKRIDAEIEKEEPIPDWVRGKKRCSCDDPGDGACPVHGKEMREQDARIADEQAEEDAKFISAAQKKPRKARSKRP